MDVWTMGGGVRNAANLAPVPMVPGKALPFALGGLGGLLIGGGGLLGDPARQVHDRGLSLR